MTGGELGDLCGRVGAKTVYEDAACLSMETSGPFFLATLAGLDEGTEMLRFLASVMYLDLFSWSSFCVFLWNMRLNDFRRLRFAGSSSIEL